ncbi:plancitoxin-1-like isoform X2 [Magallana gigas]|uniref:plancitoxin-1-like isoform X2 n=1 Tax=Magallana gigas TaxID=29159 RepID=UPI00333F6202
MKQLLLLICLLGYPRSTQGAINCKNPSGRAVDWFILFKLPKLNTGKVHTVGTEFFYMDADNQNFKITTMQNVIRPNRNPLFQTLKPLYSNSPFIQSYAMYNDQEPSGKKAAQTKAHSKGALAFDKSNGFWMISGIPRFPAEVSEGYHFSDEQKPFGQTVLCVTVPNKVKELIDTYTQLISPGLKSKLNVDTWRPNLRNGKKVAENEPFTCVGDLNRQETQFKRGGLSLCLKNKKVAETFRELYTKPGQIPTCRMSSRKHRKICQHRQKLL